MQSYIPNKGIGMTLPYSCGLKGLSCSNARHKEMSNAVYP